MDVTCCSLLVFGGARSGKSAFAQKQAEASDRELVFVATAQAHDREMEQRVAAHVAARGSSWRTIEAPYDLRAPLAETSPRRVLLVDCLTLWLSNRMLRGDAPEPACAELIEAIAQISGPVIFVSNEVGHGIVPDNALARRFRDAQGRLNQQVSAACSHVVLVAAGLPLQLKPTSFQPIDWNG